MQKLIILFINFICLVYGPVYAQRKIEKSYPLPASRKINLTFGEASLIKVKTWDKNEVGVQASVSINEGENDDAFELKQEEGTDAISLVTVINNQETIPRKSFITTKDGTRYYVSSTNWNSKEVQEFMATHQDETISFIGSGIVKDIFIEVFVPKDATLNVYSRNGDIEIENFPGPLVANSRNGLVDVTLPQNQKTTFEMRTRHGEIYTDLPLEQEQDQVMSEAGRREDKWNVVAGKLNGGGIPMNLETRNGSIYVRRQK